MLVIRETTSKLETCDLDHPIICQCRKHRQLARQEGGFTSCFPLDVLMVHSSALAVAVDSKRLMCGGFSLDETVHFASLEFITDCFGGLSLFPKGSDSGAIFVGTTYSGSPLQQVTTCSHCNHTKAGGHPDHLDQDDGSTTYTRTADACTAAGHWAPS
jgi:hypothetical protein